MVRGDRSSWLTSELNRASRSMRSWISSTMVLKELVSPCEVGVGRLGVEAGVEVTARDGAGGLRDVGQGLEQPAAGEAPEPHAQECGHDAGTEERESEDPQGVVEVG